MESTWLEIWLKEQNVLICEPTGRDVVPVKIGFPVKFW
jgi:hypothetical protein